MRRASISDWNLPLPLPLLPNGLDRPDVMETQSIPIPGSANIRFPPSPSPSVRSQSPSESEHSFPPSSSFIGPATTSNATLLADDEGSTLHIKREPIEDDDDEEIRRRAAYSSLPSSPVFQHHQHQFPHTPPKLEENDHNEFVGLLGLSEEEKPSVEEEDSSLKTSFSLYSHLLREIGSEGIESFNKWERIENFLEVPWAVEKIVLFGTIVCLDSFLYEFTILPIRAAVALYSTSINYLKICRNRPSERLSPSQKIDLIKFTLLTLSCVVLLFGTDASKIYHTIRGQDSIKLVVIFNALEIADRLCSALGQDLLDTLFSIETVSLRSNGTQPHVKPLLIFTLSLVYAVAHALVYLYQLIALNVAINSYDNSLLTLIVSNQFVEIKGSVFKSFEKEGVFQLTCADIVERFQLGLMLTVITTRNIIEMSGSDFVGILPKSFIKGKGLIETILSPAVVVLGTEMIVDWTKHSYVLKFNHIRVSAYSRFKDIINLDLLPPGISSASKIDQAPHVSRRIGLATLPLACLVVRVGMQVIGMGVSKSSISQETGEADGSWSRWIAVWGIGCVAWVCLVGLKVLLGLWISTQALRRFEGMDQREVLDAVNNKDRSPLGVTIDEKYRESVIAAKMDRSEDTFASTHDMASPGGHPIQPGGKKKFKLEEKERVGEIASNHHPANLEVKPSHGPASIQMIPVRPLSPQPLKQKVAAQSQSRARSASSSLSLPTTYQQQQTMEQPSQGQTSLPPTPGSTSSSSGFFSAASSYLFGFANASVAGVQTATDSAIALGSDQSTWIGGNPNMPPSKKSLGKERILLFPGYACKAPHQVPSLSLSSEKGPVEDDALKTFDITLLISGYAFFSRPPEQASRTQRMFTRMAKNFAALPKLPSGSASNSVSNTTSNSSLIMPTTSAATSSRLTSSPVPLDLDSPGSPSPFFTSKDHTLDTVKQRSTAQVNASSNLSASYTSEEVPFPIDSFTEEPAQIEFITAKSLSDPTPPLMSPSTPTPGNPKPDFAVVPPTPISSVKRKPWEKSASSAKSLPLHLPPPKTLSSTSSENVGGLIEPQPQQTIQSLPSNTAGILNLHEMYSNLNIRLQPFFASVLPLRTVLVEVRPKLIGKEIDGQPIQHHTKEEEQFHNVIFSQEFVTTANGTFESMISIPWDTLVESPACLGIIFPDKLSYGSKWCLEVSATLMPAFIPQGYGADGKKRAVERDGGKERGVSIQTLTPLSEAEGIRIISDIDDTVKRTDLMGGLREVFRNTFCRPYKELGVPGMSNLYNKLRGSEGHGVVKGLHFVSNSPYELFDPLINFLTFHGFPDGFSIKLKFYGGKSLFHGLFEPAGERKARSVTDILDAFPHAKFLLFGDSAEQDLDLYSVIALARPHQILGIFIRDVSPPGSTLPVAVPGSVISPTKRKNSTAASVPSPLNIAVANSSYKEGSLNDSSVGSPGTSPSKASRLASAMKRPITMARSSSRRSSLNIPVTDDPASVADILSSSMSSANNSPLNSPEIKPTTYGSFSTPPSSRPSTAPPSPILGPSGASSATLNTLAEEAQEEQQQEEIQEAVTAAKKIVQRVADFKLRFERYKKDVEAKGIVLRKFKDISEVSEEVERLAGYIQQVNTEEGSAFVRA